MSRSAAPGIDFDKWLLTDAGYGMSGPFRQGLSARGVVWAVGIPSTLTMFTTDVGLLFARAKGADDKSDTDGLRKSVGSPWTHG